MKMQTYNEQLDCIHDINLSYLLLAQQLIRDDRFTASFRLGLNESVIELLNELSMTQMIKLASVSQFICRLRLENNDIIDILTKESRIEALQKIHTSIILSTNLLDSIM